MGFIFLPDSYLSRSDYPVDKLAVPENKNPQGPGPRGLLLSIDCFNLKSKIGSLSAMRNPESATSKYTGYPVYFRDKIFDSVDRDKMLDKGPSSWSAFEFKFAENHSFFPLESD